MINIPIVDRRRSERKPAQMVVTLVINGDEADHAVDVSPHGMRLHTNLPLALGQHVALLLGDRPNNAIRARVVWLGKADSAQAGEAGFEFLKPLGSPVL